MTKISELSYNMQLDLNRHIEEFAAAFLKHTQLKPDEIVMKVKIGANGSRWEQTIWFEKKNPND